MSELVQGDRQVAVIKGRSACHWLRHQGRNRPVSRFVECILDIRLILLYTRWFLTDNLIDNEVERFVENCDLKRLFLYSEKPLPLMPRGSLPQQVMEENWREIGSPSSSMKLSLNCEVWRNFLWAQSSTWRGVAVAIRKRCWLFPTRHFAFTHPFCTAALSGWSYVMRSSLVSL